MSKETSHSLINLGGLKKPADTLIKKISNAVGVFFAPWQIKRFDVFYYRRKLTLEMPNDTDNTLKLGEVLLTKVGWELAPICGSKPVDGFWEYVKGHWSGYLPKTE